MADEIPPSPLNFGIVSQISSLLEPLSPEEREHILRTVATWFRVHLPTTNPLPAAPSVRQQGAIADEKFSNRAILSVKDFIFEKDPKTEPERMACLAYYLTHFRDTPHFKTVDLTHLNTEAAQRTFSNPAVASSNAIRDGFFVSAPKSGFKQLSAMGERFVHALPDREAAQQIRQRMVSRRGRKSGGGQSNSGSGDRDSENHGTA